MKTFPILYKRAKTGAPQQWQIFAESNKYWTEAGQVGGVITVSEPTTCEGKNIGRANETSPEMQALAEAEAKFEKKLETGYTNDVNHIDVCRTYFEPQLAHKYNDYKDSVKFPALASRKIDGLRMINVAGATTSRNGKNIVSCPHIGKALEPFFAKYPDGMIDGEIYANNEYFEKIVSIVKKTKPKSEDLVESEQKARLWIFDGIIEHSTEGFAKRFNDVRRAVIETVAPEYLKYFVFVDNVIVNSHEEFMAEHDKYVAEGFEGAMLRYADAPYECKRSKYLLKYKSFIDNEMTLLDIQEGRGGDAGMASRVIVELENGQTSEAGIRGTNAFAIQLLKNRSKYIGKKVTVRYQGFTRDGKLRFGVALAFDPFDR